MATSSLTVIGTPFSTFTRTITLALVHKHLAFSQISVFPHSETAYAHHPFGFLPTLVVHAHEGRTLDPPLNLRESQAIARYVERIAPEPCLALADGDGVVVAEQVWEVVSFVASYGFRAVEIAVVKPRLKLMMSEETSESAITQGILELTTFLERIEAQMAPEGYVFKDRLTWADLFLFPLLADLAEVPEVRLLSPRLKAWMKKMEELEAVQKTKEGTLSGGAKPPL